MVGPTFQLLARLFPFQATDAQRARYEDLALRYRALGAAEVVPALACAAGAAWLWQQAFLALWAARLARLGPARWVLAPSPYYLWLCAGFLGMLSAAPVLQVLYRTFLRERYDEYLLFTNLRVGFDTWKALRALAAVIVPAALAFGLLGVDAYAQVTDDAIVVNRFWSVDEERHPYTAVEAVRAVERVKALSGDLVQRPHLVVTFADGTRWSTESLVRDPDPATDAVIAGFVAGRAAKPVEQVDLDE
jgi:hypothetical protein